MWFVTMLVMIGQFLVIGFVLATVLFALLDWIRDDQSLPAAK